MALGQIQIENKGELYFDEISLEKALKDNSGIDGILVEKSGISIYIITYPDSKRQYEVTADGIADIATPITQDNTMDTIAKKDENTYLIQSIEDLIILSKSVNDGETYEGKTFEIVNDLNFNSTRSYINPNQQNFLGLSDINGNGSVEGLITELTTGSGFIPIGTSDNPFLGNIEGNGNSIKNLYINSTDTNVCVGFIGVGSKNTIKNLNLDNVNINGSSNNGTSALIGYFKEGSLEISNCNVSGKIEGKECTASVLGQVYNSATEITSIKIIDCINKAEINASGYSGGIVGHVRSKANDILVENCTNEGSIKTTTNSSGIIGRINSANNTEIKNCHNTGNIKANGSYIARNYWR